jgi:low temperature requirement protein LtrA
MLARHADEDHRTASSLELFFDLCFVAAVAQASSAFEHEIAGGRSLHGLFGYALVFFAIWWTWMNFTWFASAYDTDDVPYRLLTLLQITGVLVMAAGATEALERGDFTVITWGYVIMRLAMVTHRCALVRRPALVAGRGLAPPRSPEPLPAILRCDVDEGRVHGQCLSVLHGH